MSQDATGRVLGPKTARHRRTSVDNPEPPKRHSGFSADADAATSTVRARGELDILTVDLLWGTIDVLVRAGHLQITLDLAEVTSIDSAGVKLLIALQHSLTTHAGELAIINACPAVLDVLQRSQVAARPTLTE